MSKKIFFIGLLLFFSAILFTGCDESIAVVKWEFGQFPRVVYIAGVDTELDMYGASVISTTRDGHQNESPLIISDRIWATIEHSIDFATPGIYKVEIFIPRDFRLTFLVQVIDEEIFNQLKVGTQ
ncbi:MAG: hypothetical protein FWC32_05015 [Firmicutes bacterium]|nr:hypothetical protein [Bacillota bacterium]